MKILQEEAVIQRYEKNPIEAKCRFLINLAQEYYLLSQFKQAIEFYQAAMQLSAAIDPTLRAGLVLNFILASMRNGEYEAAKALADEHQELLLLSPMWNGRSAFLLAVLYLYANQPEQALGFVNLELKNEGSEFNFFMRLILSIIYYLRNDKDLALRECINIEQAVNYQLQRAHNQQTIFSKQIVLCFKRFYEAVESNDKREKEAEFTRLSKELRDSLQISDDQHPNSILTQWLLQELE